MKHFKKMMALVIAMVMVLVMSVAAFAADVTSQTIGDTAADADGNYTISVASGDNHSYKVYQILTGTLNAGESKLGNPQWGSDANATETYATVDAFINAITADGLTNQQINAIAGAVKKSNATGVGTATASNSVNVAPGYYLIEDVTENLDAGDAKSLNIVAVFNNITITPKKDTVESHKDVKDINDSTETALSAWQKVADHDKDDVIQYRIYAKLPTNNFGDYKKYPLNFVDTMSKGLTLDTTSVQLYVTSDLNNLGTAKTAPTATDVSTDDAYSSQLTGKYADGKVWKWSIEDVKAAAIGATAGQYVVLTYSATLNDNAIIGAAGNPNVMYVEYANNPNVDNPQPEGKTTPEVNIVFTYQVVVDKVKGTDLTTLTGAGFTLYKQYAAAQTDKGDNAAEDLGKTGEFWYAVGAEQYSDGTLSTFNWQRIDDGNYILKETHTPTGYNTIADMPFTVTVSHSTTDTSDLSDEISVSGSGFKATTVGGELTFTKTVDSSEFTHKIDAASGTVAAAVENNQGSTLPSTGGMGTTILYIIGAILVVCAGILLVTKKRMSAN